MSNTSQELREFMGWMHAHLHAHTHTHNTSLFASSCQHNDSNNDERQQQESCQEVAQVLHKITSMLGENDVHYTWTLHLIRPCRQKMDKIK